MWPVLAGVLLAASILGCGKAAVPVPDDSMHVPLAGGGKLTLVAINDDGDRRSRLPDGTPLEDWVVSQNFKKLIASGTGRPGSPSIVARMELPDGSEQPSVVFKVGAEVLKPGYTLLDFHQPGKPVIWYSGTGVSLGKTANVSVGIATSPWQAVSVFRRQSGKFELYSGSDFRFLALTSPSEKSRVHVSGVADRKVEQTVIVANLPTTPQPRAFRIVVRDTQGKPYGGAGSIDGKPGEPCEYWFDGKLSDVGSVDLQSREYQWASVGDVRL